MADLSMPMGDVPIEAGLTGVGAGDGGRGASAGSGSVDDVGGDRPPIDLGGHPTRSRGFDEPHGWGLAWRYALLGVVVVVVLFPIYTTVVAALKPSDKVLVNPLIPDSITLEVLGDAWTSGRLGRYLLNSLVVAVIVTVCQIITSILAAYAFAILEFPGKTVIFFVFIATLLVSGECPVHLCGLAEFCWLNDSALRRPRAVENASLRSSLHVPLGRNGPSP
jgi:hypothetical protein